MNILSELVLVPNDKMASEVSLNPIMTKGRVCRAGRCSIASEIREVNITGKYH